MQKLTITVEGKAKTGKTTCAAYVAEVLSRLGAEVSMHDIDITNEAQQVAAVERARVLKGTAIRVVTKHLGKHEPTDDELGIMGG